MKKILIVIIIILGIILISSMNNPKLKKENTIYTENKTFFEAPIQKETSGEKEQIIIGGKEITIEKLYSYEVSGRVVETYEYKDYYYGDETITSLIKQIKKNDYIKISGYLINAYWDNSYLTTSTSRDDEGNGACEVVYVTDIKWYK